MLQASEQREQCLGTEKLEAGKLLGSGQDFSCPPGWGARFWECLVLYIHMRHMVYSSKFKVNETLMLTKFVIYMRQVRWSRSKPIGNPGKSDVASPGIADRVVELISCLHNAKYPSRKTYSYSLPLSSSWLTASFRTGWSIYSLKVRPKKSRAQTPCCGA